MSDLLKIYEIMRQKETSFSGEYYIPELWNVLGFENSAGTLKRKGEINVNPYSFFCSTVDAIKEGNHTEAEFAPLIYSCLPRSLTAWRHGDDKEPAKGTFLKLILLLPLLKSYGTTILYLLPVCAHGELNKKGELGSPYAARDFYDLDPDLHDPLLGQYSPELLKTELRALIEACHIMNIRVMLDFAFRTVSRDNVLIKEHPDWFYWIDKKFETSFEPPKIGDMKTPVNVTKKNIKELYKSESAKKYLSSFTLSPDKLDSDKWKHAKDSEKNNISDILGDFGITTVPGFSDVINDNQPAWTDVTYLRYYFDNPPEVSTYIPKDQPPFIMQDGASLNVIHGEKKNTELWDYIINILPFYYKTYGIDGARIDMAHALPPELNTAIIKKIRAISHDFILWSEEFNPKFSVEAKKGGFNFISGFIYSVYKKAGCSRFNADLLLKNMLLSKIPVAGAVETPDTPRSACIYPDKSYIMMLYTINSFLPNNYPLLNSGQEVFEVQPMNLGLDNTEEGRFVLDKDDPMYGRLAFFDNYAMHWQNGSSEMQKIIRDVAKIRAEYKRLLEDKSNFIPLNFYMGNKKVTPLCFYNSTRSAGITVVANRSLQDNARIDLDTLFPKSPVKELEMIYDNGIYEEEKEFKKTIKLAPCETVILKFRY